MGRGLSASLFNAALIIVFVPLLFWACREGDKELDYERKILELGQKMFRNESMKDEQYPIILTQKRLSDTRGTESLVKVTSMGYDYFHTPSLFYENWETIKPGQLLSLLLIADPKSAVLDTIQEQYFQETYGMTLTPNKHLCVLITSYNNKENDIYKVNLDSIFTQTYTNYTIIYVDDASNDSTLQEVSRYVKDAGFDNKVVLRRNE
jgi:hypothetical protein